MSLLPIPCASYQCNSTSRRAPFGRRTVATPFDFRQRARPHALRRYESTRTPEPLAMTSTSVISPTTSNFIGAACYRQFLLGRKTYQEPDTNRYCPRQFKDPSLGKGRTACDSRRVAIASLQWIRGTAGHLPGSDRSRGGRLHLRSGLHLRRRPPHQEVDAVGVDVLEPEPLVQAEGRVEALHVDGHGLAGGRAAVHDLAQ